MRPPVTFATETYTVVDLRPRPHVIRSVTPRAPVPAAHIRPDCRRRGEQLEVVLVQQVARPDEDRPAVGPAEADPRVDQRVAVDDEVPRGARARRERRAIAGVEAAEELPGMAEQAGGMCVLAADRDRPLRDAGQDGAGDVLDLRSAGLLERRRRVGERDVPAVGVGGGAVERQTSRSRGALPSNSAPRTRTFSALAR